MRAAKIQNTGRAKTHDGNLEHMDSSQQRKEARTMDKPSRTIKQILETMANTDPQCEHCSFDCGADERCLHADIVCHLGRSEDLARELEEWEAWESKAWEDFKNARKNKEKTKRKIPRFAY
jgi:hypothetical protein